MKRYGSMVAGLLVILLLAGCGSNSGNNKEAAGNADSGSAEEKATRVVTTINGEVEIPTDPKRIAATYYVGELAALGIKPAGTVTRLLPENNPNLAAYTEGAVDLAEWPPSLEVITQLAPDLIIATDFDELEPDVLSKIAPSIIIPWSSDDIWAKLRTVASLLGKEDAAEAYIKQYEENAAAAREKIAGKIGEDETVSIVRFFGKSIRVYGARDVGHAFYEGLQLKMPPVLAAEAEANPNFTSTEDVSLEKLPEYIGDRIFVLVTDEDGDTAYKAAQQLSLWKNLPAVKNGHVQKLPADVWFNYDPISVQVTLDEAVRLLGGES